jgi:hypothetical protein
MLDLAYATLEPAVGWTEVSQINLYY